MHLASCALSPLHLCISHLSSPVLLCLFQQGCPDFLYLYASTSTTKTSNEAVVEGMGSVWDAAAESRRHVGFEAGVQDAVISYSAPPSHLPAADAFIDRSLRTHFEGGPSKWNFGNEDARFRNTVFSGGSKVLHKMSKASTRLPEHFYGPRPPM